MKEYLGVSDVVKKTNYVVRSGYLYKCPKCDSIIKDKLSRHLSTQHKYEESKSFKTQSELTVHLQCRSKKHGCPLLPPCTDCNRWFPRLDHHLLNDKKHKLLLARERDDIIQDARNSCWERGSTNDSESEKEREENIFKHLVRQKGERLQILSHGRVTTREVADKSDQKEFVRRSVPADLPSGTLNTRQIFTKKTHQN